MTRRAVQIALFASAAWLVSWPAAIVWSMVVRDVESPPWVVTLWLLLMTGSGILIAFAMLWLVIADTVGRRTPPPEEELEGLELNQEEPGDDELASQDPEDQASSAGGPPSSDGTVTLLPPGDEVGLGPVTPIPPRFAQPTPEQVERPSRAAGPNQISVPISNGDSLLKGRQPSS